MDTDIKSVLGAGAGVLGHGVAWNFAEGGYEVSLVALLNTYQRLHARIGRGTVGVAVGNVCHKEATDRGFSTD